MIATYSGAILFFLIILYSSVTIAKGNQIITLERRWFGKSMPDGRTVALKDEVGIQARILGPGFHVVTPFIYKCQKHAFIFINNDQIGVVSAIAGDPIPSGEFFAMPVECELFQNGEMFIANKGQKGPQLAMLPPGEYRINPFLFKVDIVSAVIIEENQIGLVEAVGGAACEAGHIFGRSVECDNFQDAMSFLKNKGQKGPQVDILPPGKYRINTMFFKVSKGRATVINGGKIGLVTAMDGEKIPDGRLLAKKVPGHSNFEKGEKFLKEGGEKGRQLDILMPGTYRINTNLFNVDTDCSWTNITADEVGIVTVQEGLPILDPSKIAADEVPLTLHSNFQDPAAFLANNGQKGLQIPVLRAGNYAINPWFALIETQDMVEVKIGECAVITSFVGEEGEDVTNEDVNAKIVKNGKKGIWSEPLGPGKHAINTKICKVDKVPTTQILLNWADNESSAHKYDSNLKTITLRTADAFNVNMDVSVIIHIAMKDAPKVIANLGSVEAMISQVLEPAISSHFRNAAQSVQALELYTQRSELQGKAKTHIQEELRKHHIESKDTMIADVVLPTALTEPVCNRQIAEQNKITYKTQKEAEEIRKDLEKSTAEADMQQKVVESERGVAIAENFANQAIKKAEGEAKAVEINADGKAKATKINAEADAEAVSKVGLAEAEVIEAKGKATATAYKEQRDAMGDQFAQLKIVEAISTSNLKLMPDYLIVGGTGSGSSSHLENLIGFNLMEQLRMDKEKSNTIKPEVKATEKVLEEKVVTKNGKKPTTKNGEES